MYLYVHGGKENGKGKLYFYGEAMSGVASLNYKTITGKVYLFSCNGGNGGSNSFAAQIAKKTNARVIACSGSVSFQKWFGYTYARVSSIFTAWYQFYYSSGKLQSSFYAWLMV